MLPTWKNDPGAWDLDARFATPELSEATGSIHEIDLPTEPRGMVSLMSSRHWTIGRMLSTVRIEKKCNDISGPKYSLLQKKLTITRLIKLPDTK